MKQKFDRISIFCQYFETYDNYLQLTIFYLEISYQEPKNFPQQKAFSYCNYIQYDTIYRKQSVMNKKGFLSIHLKINTKVRCIE